MYKLSKIISVIPKFCDKMIQAILGLLIYLMPLILIDHTETDVISDLNLVQAV